MTVTVVPVLRLRRATTGWSYKAPDSSNLQPGALVIVPFRNHPTLAVVWDTEQNAKATAHVAEILTHTPLVRAPHRRLIEWLADEGLCSLSTALYVWLPAALRTLPLTKPVRTSLAEWDNVQLSPQAMALHKQHAVLVPSHRDEAEGNLAKKYQAAFHSTFSDTTPAQEFATWLEIAQGTIAVAIGRERALYAPWMNLRHITVIEPEDISYHTGQTPYLNLISGAEQLAQASKAALSYRTTIPLEAAQILWPETTCLPFPPVEVELTDLRHAKIINDNLLRAIHGALQRNQHVIILYNAHDRWKQQEDGSKKAIPGIETLTKRLTEALGKETVLPLIHFGTRSLLASLPRPIGLTVFLTIDPLLFQLSFADQLHGWGDIGRLVQTGAPMLLQTRQPEHPLVQAVMHNRFADYCLQEVSEAQKAGRPPVSEQIVCAIPVETKGSPTSEELTLQLRKAAPVPWQVSYPRPANRRGKQMTIITLHAPQHTRVPLALRIILAALPRPWKVERGPWYAI